MQEPMVFAARRYVFRCRAAGDTRPVRVLLEDLLHPGLAAELAARI